MAGDPVVAARFLERAAPVTLRHQLTLQTARAVMAEAFGDVAEAAALYDEAAARWSDYGDLPEAGNALLGAGRCRSRLGEPGARERLLRARQVFEGLGAVTLTSAVDEALAAAPPSDD